MAVRTHRADVWVEGATVNGSVFCEMEAALHGYLVDVRESALTEDDQTLARMARFELPRLATALKAVLDEHQPDERGRCPTCRTTRFGRAPTPCRAYLTAQLCLMITADDEGDPERTERIRLPVTG